MWRFESANSNLCYNLKCSVPSSLKFYFMMGYLVVDVWDFSFSLKLNPVTENKGKWLVISGMYLC